MTEANKPRPYSMGQFQVIETPNSLTTYTHPKTGLSVWTMETEKSSALQTFQNNFHLLEIVDAREKMEVLQRETAQYYANERMYAYMINALNEHIVDMEWNGVRYMIEGDKEWNKQVMGLRQSLVEMYKRERELLKQLKTASNHAFYASLSIIFLLFCLGYVLYNSSSTL